LTAIDGIAEERPALAFTSARGGHVLETNQWVGAGLEETFALFSDAANLEAITPPSLGFEILTPLPIEMHDGALIEYRLSVMGLPINWLTRIERWIPNHSFVDVQLRGPYARWVHEHTFTAESGGTRVRDRVEYALPFAPLSEPVHSLFVRPMVESIFRHRHDSIARLLG